MYEKQLRTGLKRVVDAYIAAENCAPSRICKQALGDPKWMTTVLTDESKGFTIRTYDTVMQWLSNNWPKGARWPKGVPRPKKTSSSSS